MTARRARVAFVRGVRLRISVSNYYGVVSHCEVRSGFRNDTKDYFCRRISTRVREESIILFDLARVEIIMGVNFRVVIGTLKNFICGDSGLVTHYFHNCSNCVDRTNVITYNR